MAESHSSKDLKADDPLYRLRHSLSHVMAQAVLQVRPGAQLGFGPPVRNGFYYDFLLSEPLTEADLPDIEKRMRKLIAEKLVFEREDLPREEAIRKLEGMGQTLKSEYSQELLGKYPSLSFYKSGTFTDMCEGPHVKDTSEIPPTCFKLDSLAGSYWRGDSKRPMLQRLYAVAFRNEKELKEYLHNRQLALQRDHRKLGKELEIFDIRDEVGKGLILWLPNGTIIRDEFEKYAKELEFKDGFQRVTSPHLANSDLYRMSGHLPYYAPSMFPPMRDEESGEEFYLKAMNCPHHHIMYLNRPRSYRELPLRFAEYGTVYRYEKSGQLAGLLRVRGLSMNDAHIYCTPEQVKSECHKIVAMHRHYYEKFHLDRIWVRLSTHDAEKGKFIEGEERWRQAEETLREVVESLGVDYEEGPGEAAFYGPKLDYQTENVVGREETLSTIQLDFAAAERFGLEYAAADGSRQKPLVIHRAPLSTHERFISFIIERWGGAFPTWLSPVQVRIVPVAADFTPYAQKLAGELRDLLVRAEVDESSDTIGKKVRNAVTKKIPNIWVVGAKEVEVNGVTWRRYAAEKQAEMPAAKAKDTVLALIRDRVMDNFSDVDLPVD